MNIVLMMVNTEHKTTILGVGGIVLLLRDRDKIVELGVACSASICVFETRWRLGC